LGALEAELLIIFNDRSPEILNFERFEAIGDSTVSHDSTAPHADGRIERHDWKTTDNLLDFQLQAQFGNLQVTWFSLSEVGEIRSTMKPENRQDELDFKLLGECLLFVNWLEEVEEGELRIRI
jgi:hypothetical protein